MITRETIIAALFTKLQTIGAAINTYSRRLVLYSDVAAGAQPALFLTVRHEDVKMAPPGVPPVSTITCDVYLYGVTTDPNQTPETILNPLVDAVAAVLAPDNVVSGKQTLGGKVQHCWIEGRIETSEGLLGGQGVVIIPIMIKAT